MKKFEKIIIRKPTQALFRIHNLPKQYRDDVSKLYNFIHLVRSYAKAESLNPEGFKTVVRRWQAIKKENFELEVFIEEEKTENGIVKKEWKKLNFPKKLLYINNGILLDEPLNKEAQDLGYDKTFANHYLNILIDDEINLPPEHQVAVSTYDTAVTNADKPFGEDC